MISRVFLGALTDSDSEYLFLLSRWQDAGGYVLYGSDCTRRPERGLCSLIRLEAVLGRRETPSHPFIPVRYPQFS